MTDASFGAALTRLWPHAPKPLLEGIITTAPAVFEKYGFTPLLQKHVMAEISHECGAGHELVENGNYSPEGIVKTWPSRFHSLTEAMPYAHNGEKLFNKVYGGRMGNTRPGDGSLFRGRGGTNTTGHDGYYALARKMALDLLSQPDLVNDPKLFLECAVVDFILCGCVPFAEKGDIRGERHALNGGLIGLAEVEQWLKRWEVALAEVHGPDAVAPPVVPRAPGELRFGDTGFEVKGLQLDLAAKGYPAGADDGQFHEATRRAVLGFQGDHGLPTTGVVDQATKDAIARSPGMPIAETRASATVQDLRQAGSRTVAGADRISFIAKVKAALSLGVGGGALAGHAGGLDLDSVQGGIDKAQQAAGMLDQVKGLAAPLAGFLKPLLVHPATVPIAVAIGVGAVLLMLEARKIRGARVEDHRSAANMGR